LGSKKTCTTIAGTFRARVFSVWGGGVRTKGENITSIGTVNEKKKTKPKKDTLYQTLTGVGPTERKCVSSDGDVSGGAKERQERKPQR